MKRLVMALLLLSLAFSCDGCVASVGESPPLVSIKTYRDVPGVTEKEISAIEELKAQRESFSYGSVPATEAFILPDGSYAGFTAKFCELLTELFEIKFVQHMYEWDALLDDLVSQKLDFTGELTPTEEHEQIYVMTSPIAERLLQVFTCAGSDKIKSELDVNGLKIGFLENSIAADSIKKTYPVTFTSIYIDNYPTAALMLANGVIDAFIEKNVADSAFDEYDFIDSCGLFPVVHESVSLASANRELTPIVSVMNKYLAAGGIDKLYELYQEGNLEYTKYKLRRSFTREEQDYLDELQRKGTPISVLFEHDNYPVNFYNEKDREFQGIALDILAEIGRLTDITFVPAFDENSAWEDMLNKLETGEIPMAAQLLYSKARKDDFIWSAVPYSHSFYAIISRSDYPNLASYQVIRYSVGTIKKSGHEDIYRELFPDNNNIREYNTAEECLNALEDGEVDLLMASEYMLLAQTNYREKPGLKVNIKLNQPLDSYFGYSKNETTLCSIIDKVQQYVNTDEIEISWTGRIFDYSKKIAEERAYYLTIFVAILLLVLMVAVLLLLRNIRLGKRLKELASKDALTDILNRRYFMELSLMHIERSLRLGTDSFVIIFDLDHFKVVNDTYGHLAGDAVLKEVTKRVKSAIRPYDLFGRYGGEEFILLISDADKPIVITVAERIRQDIYKSPVEYDGKKIAVSASFGIAYAAPINDIDMATQCADEALYKAKESGRNSVVFYEESTTLL